MANFLNKNKYYCFLFLVFFLIIVNNPFVFIFQSFAYIFYLIILTIPFATTYFRNNNFENKYIIKLKGIFENPFQFSLISFLFIFACLQSIYNQKTLTPHGFETSIFNGYFTLAGALPISDNYSYFSDINLFLDQGKFQSSAIFRPLSSLFLGSIYKLCDRNFELYSSVINFLLIFSIGFFSITLKKLFGVFVSFLSAFILCVYAGLFLNTFLTELAGLMLGLIAIALLLDGLVNIKKNFVFAGFALLCLAFQLRSGMELFLVLFSFSFIFMFRKKFNLSLINSFVFILLIIISFFATKFVLILLTENNNSISNIGFFVYKIYKNAETWDYVYRDYPQISSMNLYDQSLFVNNIAIDILKNDFIGFVVKYFKYAFTNISILPDLLFPFYYLLPFSFNIITFFAFFLTPIFNKDKKIFFYVSLILVLGVFISIPIIRYVELRALAVMMPLQILIYIVSLQTLLKIIANTFVSGNKYWDEIYNRLKTLNIKDFYIAFTSINISKQSKKSEESKIVIIAVTVIVLIVLIIPVAIDKLRVNSINQVSYYNKNDSLNDTFYLFPENSIWKKIIDKNQIPTNNYEVPMHVFMSNNPFAIQIPVNTFVFSSFYYLNKNQKSCQAIFINEKLFKSEFNSKKSYKLKGRNVNIQGGLCPVFLTDSVIIN